jgi:hypothetical protein
MTKILNGLRDIKFNGEQLLKYDDISVFKSILDNEEKQLIDDYKESIKINKNNKQLIKEIREQIKNIKQFSKQAIVRPYFFQYCGEGKDYKFEKFETPMDYLQDVIDNIPTAKPNKTIPIAEVLIDDYSLHKANRNQINNITNIIVNLNKDIRSIYQDQNRDRHEDFKRKEKLKNEAIIKIKKLNFYVDTVLSIFNILYGAYKKDHELKKNKRLVLSILWKSQKDVMTKAFKKLSTGDIKQLKEDKNGKIYIWGVNYNLEI